MLDLGERNLTEMSWSGLTYFVKLSASMKLCYSKVYSFRDILRVFVYTVL
jgi:hypothetical protein